MVWNKIIQLSVSLVENWTPNIELKTSYILLLFITISIINIQLYQFLQDGTIGEDLVVRPLPLSLQSLVKETPREEELNENELPPDDQLFMDHDDPEGDMLLSEDGLSLSPDELAISSGFGGGLEET